MDQFHEQFRRKVNQDYREYICKIALMEKTDIIIKAREIALVNWLHDEFQQPDTYPAEQILYLTQFNHPLFMVFDAWNSNEHDMRDTLEGLLWDMADKQAYEDSYVKIDPINEEEQEI